VTWRPNPRFPIIATSFDVRSCAATRREHRNRDALRGSEEIAIATATGLTLVVGGVARVALVQLAW